jgi:hypothetical protein
MKVDLREVLPFPYPVPHNNENSTRNDSYNDNYNDNGTDNSNSNDSGTEDDSGHITLPLDSNGFQTYTNQQLIQSATEKL